MESNPEALRLPRRCRRCRLASAAASGPDLPWRHPPHHHPEVRIHLGPEIRVRRVEFRLKTEFRNTGTVTTIRVSIYRPGPRPRGSKVPKTRCRRSDQTDKETAPTQFRIRKFFKLRHCEKLDFNREKSNFKQPS